MITEINELKTLAKHIYANVTLSFMVDIIQIKSGITVNVGVKSVKIRKNIVCEKDYIWNPATCTCENGKYVGSIIDDLVVTCDEITEATKTVPTKKYFNKKRFNINYNNKKYSTNFYIFVAFLLITKALSIAVSIYC